MADSWRGGERAAEVPARGYVGELWWFAVLGLGEQSPEEGYGDHVCRDEDIQNGGKGIGGRDLVEGEACFGCAQEILHCALCDCGLVVH